MIIYHNPRCTKSRESLQLIKNHGINPEIIEYLKDVPTEAELTDLISKLDIRPEDLIRKNESIYKEKFRGRQFKDHEWIRIMIEYPKLIERPIVVKGYKAIIGRPPERVLELM